MFVGLAGAEVTTEPYTDLEIAQEVVFLNYVVNENLLSLDLEQLKQIDPSSSALDVNSINLESDSVIPYDPNREYPIPAIDDLPNYNSSTDRTSDEIVSDITYRVQKQQFLEDLWSSFNNDTLENTIFLSYITDPSILTARKNEYQTAISAIDNQIAEGQQIEENNLLEIAESILIDEKSNISSHTNMNAWAEGIWTKYAISSTEIVEAQGNMINATLTVQELQKKKREYERIIQLLDNFNELHFSFQVIKEAPISSDINGSVNTAS